MGGHSPRRKSTALRALREEVLDAATNNFELRADLTRLSRVVAARAPEATVFYCGRVLEALNGAAVEAITGEPVGNAYAGLVRLGEMALASPTQLAYFHALRRLGNEARHMHRVIRDEDAEVAQVLLERFLAWHFASFPFGPQLPTIYRTGVDRAFDVDPTLARAMRLLERPRQNLRELGRLWRLRASTPRGRTPIIAALYAESLIEIGGDHREEALRVVEQALETHSGDLRLRQLRGWALRLVGRLDDSDAVLSELLDERHSDEETVGILAGTRKRIWDDDSRWVGRPKKRAAYLRQVADLYRSAWKHTEYTGTYAGINAASMSLLCGEGGRSRNIAAKVVAVYEQRRGRLAPGHAIAFTGYWDVVIMAEATLLLGDYSRAAAMYRDAFRRHAESTTYIETTRNQLSLICRALKLGDVDAFLGRAPAATTSGGKMARYDPKPLDTSTATLSENLSELCERLAEHAHDVWATKRMAEGWSYGNKRDDAAKHHPDLVAYDDLPDSEKEYDRAMVRETLKAILAMGYRISRHD